MSEAGPRAGSLYALPQVLEEERFDTLEEGAGWRLERIVSHGQASPEGFWYDQPQDEWVVLLRGRAALRFAGEAGLRELGPGDWVAIPAGCRHRVEWTAEAEPTVWLALHTAPGPA